MLIIYAHKRFIGNVDVASTQGSQGWTSGEFHPSEWAQWAPGRFRKSHTQDIVEQPLRFLFALGRLVPSETSLGRDVLAWKTNENMVWAHIFCRLSNKKQ